MEIGQKMTMTQNVSNFSKMMKIEGERVETLNGDDDDTTSQGSAQGGPLGLIGYRTACDSSGKRGSPTKEDAKQKKLQTQRLLPRAYLKPACALPAVGRFFLLYSQPSSHRLYRSGPPT